MTPRHWLMAIGLAGAAALVAFGDSTPEAEIAEAVVRSDRPAPVAVLATSPGTAADAAILRLQDRAALIGDGDDALGGADGVFASQNWNPPPPKQVAAPPPPPPPPPSAPPMPYTFLGKAAADGQWEVYLARDETTYVVRDQTVIDGTYRVESIAPPTMTLTYLPLKQVQQINIGVFE